MRLRTLAAAGSLDPVEAVRAATAADVSPAALAADEVRYLLTIPVAVDCTLRDRPGLYSRQGVSLQRDAEGWVFAFNAERLVRWTRAAAHWGGCRPGGVFTSSQWLGRVRPHPGFLGQVRPPGAVGGGWFGVALDADTMGAPGA